MKKTLILLCVCVCLSNQMHASEAAAPKAGELKASVAEVQKRAEEWVERTNKEFSQLEKILLFNILKLDINLAKENLEIASYTTGKRWVSGISSTFLRTTPGLQKIEGLNDLSLADLKIYYQTLWQKSDLPENLRFEIKSRLSKPK